MAVNWREDEGSSDKDKRYLFGRNANMTKYAFTIIPFTKQHNPA